jgi:hypothetical protein
MQQRWRQIALPSCPQRLRCIAAPIVCRPQIAQIAATQRDAESQAQPQLKCYGVNFDKRRGKHNSQVCVPRSKVPLQSEARGQRAKRLDGEEDEELCDRDRWGGKGRGEQRARHPEKACQ